MLPSTANLHVGQKEKALCIILTGVGSAVGAGVGCGVGAGVGCAVGSGVGAGVGSGVGICVMSITSNCDYAIKLHKRQLA